MTHAPYQTFVYDSNLPFTLFLDFRDQRKLQSSKVLFIFKNVYVKDNFYQSYLLKICISVTKTSHLALLDVCLAKA